MAEAVDYTMTPLNTMTEKYDAIIVGGGPAGIFVVGDGAGVSRGLVQSSASGVVAVRERLRKSKS